jgi:hypothetical protein
MLRPTDTALFSILADQCESAAENYNSAITLTSLKWAIHRDPNQPVIWLMSLKFNKAFSLYLNAPLQLKLHFCKRNDLQDFLGNYYFNVISNTQVQVDAQHYNVPTNGEQPRWTPQALIDKCLLWLTNEWEEKEPALALWERPATGSNGSGYRGYPSPPCP